MEQYKYFEITAIRTGLNNRMSFCDSKPTFRFGCHGLHQLQATGTQEATLSRYGYLHASSILF